MVKVLIYSSKEIYDNAPFEGRAEAHMIAYRVGDYYEVVKNRTSKHFDTKVLFYRMERFIELAELDEWNFEKKSHETIERYKNSHLELMKNA